MTLKIEKNVPLPNRAGKKSGLYKELLKMKIGDSFTTPDSLTKRTEVYNAIKHIRNFIGQKDFKMVTRKTGNVIRYWRTA